MTEATTQTISEATSSEVIVHTPEEVAEAVIKGCLPPPRPGKGKEGFEALRKGRESERQITKEDVEKAGEIMDEELRRKAESILTNLRDTDSYLQALERIQKEGLTETAADKVFRELTGQNRASIEKKVIEFLSSQSAIRNLFRGKNEKEISKALSTLIATQPQFREALVRMTKDALAGFESLPKVSEEGRELENKRRELAQLQMSNDTLLAELAKRIRLSGDKAVDQLRRMITTYQEESSLILNDIFEHLKESLPKEIIDDVSFLINTYASPLGNINADIAKKEKLKSEKERQKSLTKSRSLKAASLDEEIRRLEEDLVLLKQQKEVFERIKTVAKPEILGRINDLLILKRELDSRGGEEVQSSMISKLLKNILVNNKNIKSLQKEVEQLEAQLKEKQADLAARRVAERDLVEGLEAVANDSFVEFLEEKAREMAKKDEEKRNTESDEALRRFDEALSKRYVEFSPSARKYIHHRYQTGQDMRLLALGDEGGKIIVARILFNNNTLTSLGTLTPEQLSQVEKVYQQRGADLRKRLMTDYFRQRTFFDRNFIKFGKWFSKEVLFEGGFGALRITDAEWEEIGRHFGQEVDTALQASKQGQEVLRQLKEKGININWNLKWLLYILLGLGAVGTILGVKAITGL